MGNPRSGIHCTHQKYEYHVKIRQNIVSDIVVLRLVDHAVNRVSGNKGTLDALEYKLAKICESVVTSGLRLIDTSSKPLPSRRQQLRVPIQ